MPPTPPAPLSAAPQPSSETPGRELLELARQTAEAHVTFQRRMAEAHAEYLRVLETILAARPGAISDAGRPAAGGSAAATSAAAQPATSSDAVGAATPDAGRLAATGSASRPESVAGGVLSVTVPAQSDRKPATLSGTPSHPGDVSDIGTGSLRPAGEAEDGRRHAGEVEPPDGGPHGGAERSQQDLAAPTPRPQAFPTAPDPAPALASATIPASATAPAAAAADVRTAQQLVRLTTSWVKAPLGGLALPGLHGAAVHIIDGGSGLGAAVAGELTGRGLVAVEADRPGPGGVVFLGGMARPAAPEDAIATQLAALKLARGSADRGIFVTVADTMTGTTGAWLGGLSGLLGPVGRERPSVSVVSVECERGDRDPAAVGVLIADELTRGAGAQRVRLAADGTRSVAHLVPAAPGKPRAGGIGPESVIVASGGARGDFRTALVELARVTRCRLVLIGRTPLAAEPAGLADARDEAALLRKFAAGTGGPDGLAGMRSRARSVLAAREVRATIDACVAAGGQARYVCVDLRDPASLAGELDWIRAEWGSITGLVHGAGGTEQHSADDGQQVSTRLTGLPALLAATARDPLDTIVFFSSVAGWTARLSEGQYAMADATLDRIAEAEQLRRPGCLVRSLAWGPWQDGESGPEAIPVAVGTAAFLAELASDGPAQLVLAAPATVPERPEPITVVVGPETHPWLNDHRPRDIALLPLAAGLGWLAAAARVRERDAVLTTVRVLRAISTEQPQTLGVATHGRAVSLTNGAGEPCVQARFGAPGPDRQWRPAGDPARFPGSSIYSGRPLFHGPRLQAVRSLGEIGPEGVVGTVLGATAMGWPADDLPVDLAALDGVLQLSGVWAMDEHRPVLPTGVAECRIHRWGRLPGPALCVVAGGSRDDLGARCDAALVGPDGDLWMELLGIAFVASADAVLSAP